jgi:transcriptional regulator with XRE-family HTH domain
LSFPPTSITSAGGQLRKAAAVVVFAVLGPVTTATPCDPCIPHAQRPASTTSGAPMVKPSRVGTGDAIAELRRISGLTWEQLAGMLQVSRRTLHFWATDKQMHPANEQRVHRVLGVLRRIDRGFSTQNRTLLLSPLEAGVMPYDLLRDERYDDVVERLGEGHAPHRLQLPRTSVEGRARRRPLSVAILLDARQDDVHKKIGRRIQSQPIRKPKEK